MKFLISIALLIVTGLWKLAIPIVLILLIIILNGGVDGLEKPILIFFSVITVAAIAFHFEEK